MATMTKQALRELAGWDVEFHPLIAERVGEELARDVQRDVRQRLEALLPMMPDPGWKAPQMRVFSLSGALYIAYYLALRDRGQTAAEVWQICEQGTRNRFLHMSKMSRRFLSWSIFSAPWKLLGKWLAQRCRQDSVGGWRMQYVPQRGAEFDYGVTYTRCAIHQLAQDAGAREFAPFICQADVVGSEVFDWGLRRTETLAQGGATCDFRFRRGGSTEVRFRLPVIAAD